MAEFTEELTYCYECKGRKAPCEAPEGEHHCSTCGRFTPYHRCRECQRVADEGYAHIIEEERGREQQRLREQAIERRTKDLIAEGYPEKKARKMAQESLKDVVPNVDSFVPTNPRAYEAFDHIDQQARDIMESEGISYSEAMEIVHPDSFEQTEPRKPRDEYLGGSIESIAFDKKPGKGGGSKSRGKKSPKKGTWVCPNCKLEFCEHRPKAGRPRKEPEIRDIRFRVHMTRSTYETIVGMGLNTDDALAAFTQSVREERPFDDVLKEWQALYPLKAVKAGDERL